jgi:citrate synthase
VRALRKKGEVPPGFGHPLYPGGDPRAKPLLAIAKELLATTRSPLARRSRTLLAIVDAVADAARRDSPSAEPSSDVGIAALVAALGAEPAAGSGLFAVARSAGWLAHALEQRTAGYLLRPRARYTGVPVG